MMMTPSELREHEFKGVGRNAYKADDVDNFFGEVAVAYEKIFRENAELIKRVSLLADRLEQFKHDEDQIKQAVIGAQKAADIIIKEAETAVEDSKEEAEAILAAAKGEANIIKSDAEKQAIADSDLLLSIARDKAEEIINKAKEEAHGILIEANDSAKSTVGAATRTITSESLHYEMLKKEVSEFRASILAQYKAHIELISKLPEIAVEQAQKDEALVEEAVEETVEAVEELDIVEEIASVDPDNDIIEFVDSDNYGEDAQEIFELEEAEESEEEYEGEAVVKTTLPYDFFEENTSLEFVTEEPAEESEEDAAEDDFDIILASKPEAFEAEVEDEAIEELKEEEEPEEAFEEPDVEEEPAEDIPISRGFSVNTIDINESLEMFSDSTETRKNMFASFETIEDDEDEAYEEPKKKKGLFRRKK